MSQKGTNLIGNFRGKDVLKLARLLLDFVLILNLQGLREQTLRKAMPANHIGCALPTGRREFNDELAVLCRMRVWMNDFMTTV